MTDFFAAPFNGIGAPAPATDTKAKVKPTPKAFVGRRHVKPEVENAVPCEIREFCLRHRRARQLYDDRRWSELLSFLQEPRTRAWWCVA